MRRHTSLALSTAAFTVLGSSLQAASMQWNNTAADWPPTASQVWTVGSNWLGGTAPGTADSAVIQNGGAALVSSAVTVSTGQMGNNAAGASLYIANGGSLAITNTSATAWRFFNVGPTRGYIESGGTFTVGGTLNVGMTADAATASIESAGTVSANSMIVSRGSVYTMTGGTLTLTQTYDSLVVGNMDALAPTVATFKQSGGSISSTGGQLQLRAGGTYEISGGSINTGAGLSFRYATATPALGGTIRVVGSGASEINLNGLRYFATADGDNAKFSFILDNGAKHITKINLTASGTAGANVRRGTLEVGLGGGVLLSGTDFFDVIEAPTIAGTNYITGPGPLWTHGIADGDRDTVRVSLNAEARRGELDAAIGSASFDAAAYGYVDLLNVTGNSLPIYLDLAGGTLSNLTAALNAADIAWTTSNLPDGYEVGLIGLDPSVSGGAKFAWDLSSIDPSMKVQGIGTVVVPEPASVMMLSAVVCGGLLRRSRRH